MNWFNQNPFLAGLSLLTAVAGMAAIYFVLSASGELTAQQDEYAAQTSNLRRIQDAKPFPDQATLELAEKEGAEAAALLKQLESTLASQTAPLDASLTPQGFQDQLSAATGLIGENAAAKKVSLPEDFYLGFEQYRSQPPPGEAAPALGQQLESIGAVVSLLIDNSVIGINSLNRLPLSLEGAREEPDKAGEENTKSPLVLAPFEVEFVSKQAAFQQALAAIISAEPLVVVRLLSVMNSQPAPPSKQPPESENTSETPSAEDAERIPVLFGEETLTVKMRLATPSGGPELAQE